MAFHRTPFSSLHPWTYDVFLNFRGEDTRDTFVAHLHGALEQKGFITFIDGRLKKGEEISPELLKAIEGSRISVVVFSPNYASSSWCLNELLKIIDCMEKKGQVVLPVFYHVEPTHVRNQTDIVGEALAKFKDDKKVQEWKKALRKVANLSGFPHQKGNEYELIQKRIIQRVLELVQFPCLHVAENAIGIQSRVKDFMKHLDIGEKKNVTCMVGIWGGGGIGKTTIAKVIYNSIAHVFDGACFLANVRETTEKDSSKALSKDGLIKLQNKLLFEILGNDSLRSDNVDEGIVKMKRSLGSKKILLILDDVNRLEQLKKLAGENDWFGLGSVIIITTRDKSLLTSHMWKFEENFIYEVEKLNVNEALELFNMNAFKTNKPDDESLELAKEVVCYVGGLPLALTVLGSALCGKHIDFQKEKLKNFKRFPNKNIHAILKFSYNDLEQPYNDVFLDIACFFKGMCIKDVEQILTSYGYPPKLCIKELEDKYLIKTKFGRLEMHDLVQDMGREIVQRESPTIGKRSRLWFHEDVRHVLEENTGTIKVKGILIDLPGQDEIYIHPKAFNKMKELKLFINRNARILGEPAYISNELRCLEWPEYNGDSMPSNFHGKALIRVKMPGSKLQSLKSFKNCQNITIMDFSQCQFLKETSDLSGIPNLKQLKIEFCHNLFELHPSIGCMEKLLELDLFACSNLRRFPRIRRMRSLRKLTLSHCERIEKFPQFECPMESLCEVHLLNTSIEHLPSSFRNLINSNRSLVVDMDGCKKLKNFPGGILPPQLEYHGSPYDCLELEKFSKKADDGQYRLHIESRKESKTSSSPRVLPLPLQTREILCRHVNLVLSGSSIVSLPACIQSFLNLSHLKLHSCMKLQEIAILPPFLRNLSAWGCNSLERFSVNACDLPCLEEVDFGWPHKNIVNDVEHFILSAICEQRYLVTPRFEIIYPGNEIPSWFSHCEKASNGYSCEIIINEPAHLGENFRGFAFCVTFVGTDGVEYDSLLRIDLICGGEKIESKRFEHLRGNHIVFYFVLPEGFRRGGNEFELKWDDIQVRFWCEAWKLSLVSCGVHLLCSHEGNLTNRCTVLDTYVLHDNKYVFCGSLESWRQASERRHEDPWKYLTKLPDEDLVDANVGMELGERLCKLEY